MEELYVLISQHKTSNGRRYSILSKKNLLLKYSVFNDIFFILCFLPYLLFLERKHLSKLMCLNLYLNLLIISLEILMEAGQARRKLGRFSNTLKFGLCNSRLNEFWNYQQYNIYYTNIFLMRFFYTNILKDIVCISNINTWFTVCCI